MGKKLANPSAAIIGLSLFAATIATYWPVTHHDFIVYDDPIYVTENPHVRAGLTWRGITWAFSTSHGGNWHPLVWLSLMLDSELFGEWAGGFHLSNVLLHTVNALLLFSVLVAATGALWPSAFVAAMFALHPLHVESVAWVAERKDVLCTFFGLLSLLCYVRFAKSQHASEHPYPRGHAANEPFLSGPGQTRRWYWAALTFFALGLMSKPMLVTLPFVLVLLDFWPLGRIQPSSNWPGERRQPLRLKPLTTAVFNLLREKLPFFALTLISCVITIQTQGKTGSVASLDALPLGNRLAQIPISYLRYLGKTFVPNNLAVFYPYRLVGWDSALPFVATLTVVAIAVGVIFGARRAPYLVTGWFWFFGTLVPVIGLVQAGRQSIADRYTYIPLIGIFMVVAWAGAQLAARSQLLRVLCVSAGLALTLGAGSVTRAQLQHWKNSKELFQHALRVTSQNEVAHNNLGVALWRAGELEAAQRQFEAALKINPRNADARSNLGLTLAKAGKIDEGLAQLRAALEISPKPTIHYKLATVLAQLGKQPEALEHLRTAVTMKPDYFDARLDLGTSLARLGNFEEAATHFKTAVKLRPDHPDAWFNLGAALVELGKLNEAEAALAASVRLNPRDPQARRLLCGVALRQRKLDMAITNLVELVELQPDATNTFELAQLLVQTGRAEQAIQYYRTALELDPDSPTLCNNLALILATHPDESVRNGAEAVKLAERACHLTGWQMPVFLSTLAAAYAETGRFDDAVRTAEKAKALAEAAGQTNLVQRNEELLQLYRAGKPFRDPTLGSTYGKPPGR